MKHLLLACFFYPPDGGSGTQRPLSIARHAESCGWRVTILTRDKSHSRGVWDPEDRTLAQNFEHVREVRVPVPEGSNAAQMIAPEDGRTDPWLEALTRQVAEINQSDPIDHVLITMPPYGMAPLAGMIQDACPELPVSIDLRDPWAFDGAFAYPNKSLWRQSMSAMQQTLQRVDGAVVNTPQVLKRVLDEFKGIDPVKLEVVTNGFELDLFDSPQPPQPEGYLPDHFHMVHVGTLHSQAVMRSRGLVGWLRRIKTYRAEPVDLVGRTAEPILGAIAKLKKQGYPGIDRLRLVLVGVDDQATKKMAQQGGCADHVLMTGYMPHDKAVAWLRWAQCLFLPLHGLPDGHRSLIIPGKTYEYLASQTPILGAVPQGDARQFLEQSERAMIAPPCDVNQISQRLAEMIDAHRKGDLPKGRPEAWTQQFSRPVLTRRLCEFLERVGQAK